MLDEIILEIHKLIEYPFFRPFWAFGRWRYKTTNDLKKVLENYKNIIIPLNIILVDSDP